MKSFFRDKLGEHVKHVRKIMKKHSEHRNNFSGRWLSEVSFASAKNKAEFKGKQIIILHDCGLAVMKVDVLFGFLLLQQEFCVLHKAH